MGGSIRRLLFRTFAAAGGDRLWWKRGSGDLRILCYHGVCEDRLAAAEWVPSYFVTQSAFEKQLQYLQRFASVLPLGEAVEKLVEGTLPPRSVSLTFDDGYANNLTLAYPLLRRYGIPATIFLSTACVESGDHFPFLKLKLIQLNGHTGSDRFAAKLLEYKTNPLDAVLESAEPWWSEVSGSLSGGQEETLRPMTIDDVKAADGSLIEFGAHGHTHCILKNESPQRRQEEIRTSVRKVAEWTGRPTRLFSYPNGGHGDFDDTDKETLRAESIRAAVSGIAGTNDDRSDLLELRRYPVGIHHDEAGFRAEVSGFRTALLAASGRMEP